jgi:hypothetical protein
MLETTRLRLRPWDLWRDLPAFSAICSQPDVMRYIGDGHVRLGRKPLALSVYSLPK